jgi:hypothetical protein
VGLLSWLRGDAHALRYGLSDPAYGSSIASPWHGDSHLTSITALDDIFNGSVVAVTRAEAMSVPTWSEARTLVCDVISRNPLVARDATGAPLATQPRWLSTSKYFPVRQRMVWTIDDVAHYGMSLWLVDRGAPDQSGRKDILDAARVDWDSWSFEQIGGGWLIKIVNVDGTVRYIEDQSDEYILFTGSNSALLTRAASTIRGAKDLETQWTARVRNPLPLVEIRYTGDEDLTDEEQRDIRSKYLSARQDPDGVVMVTPRGFEVHAQGADDVNMFVEGRNAVGLDIARFWAIKASMLDASQVNGSSVDYENLSAGRTAYLDLTLRTWAMPIEERLSQDDVTARGTYIQFDLSGLSVGPDTGSGPILSD